MCVFFLNDTATTEIYTLALHDALPIYSEMGNGHAPGCKRRPQRIASRQRQQRGNAKARRQPQAELCQPGEIGRAHVLNSSHANISYAVFCMKKKNMTMTLMFSRTSIPD